MSTPVIRTDWKTGGAVLEIDPSFVDLTSKKSIAQELGLLTKPSFHFTILGTKTKLSILALRPNATDEEQENLLAYIEQLANNFSWEVTMRDEFYLLKQDYNDDNIAETRTTIIQMADIPDIEDFYRELNTLLSTKFDTPLPHVTLYSGSTRPDKMLRGIGVYCKKDLEKMGAKKI
jgi:hypothetical protein